MICCCGNKLSGNRSHLSEDGSVKTRKLKCMQCGRIFTSVEILLTETPRKGEGAYAMISEPELLRRAQELKDSFS
jgi:transcriptional regulator NrdR family protein